MSREDKPNPGDKHITWVALVCIVLIIMLWIVGVI
jgi:hypothetical protein